MHWKIARDPFYADLFPLLGQAGIEEAGFFFDSATEDYDWKSSCKLLCTPLNLLESITAKKAAVLLSTGSFCPIHQGHINMLSLAKETVEQAGFEVLGAYLSPGHAEYVEAKTGAGNLSIHERIQLIHQLIRSLDINWLMLDPWEGLFNTVAINFTEAIARLAHYLNQHLHKEIEVIYVCGADNARFSLSFLQKGHCVVVGRPSYENQYQTYQEKTKGCSNIYWTRGADDSNSTSLRLNSSSFNRILPKKLCLRMEGVDPRELPLLELLKANFEELEPAFLKDQKLKFEKEQSKKPCVSLDSLIKGEANLAISRVYDFFGARLLGFSARPGLPNLAIQLESIDQSLDYTLFDDDSHSGYTFEVANQFLKSQHIKITSSWTLQPSIKDNCERLDVRDFLIGAENSGLVLSFGQGQLLRAPYIYPFVCPYIRASIADPMTFSISVWEINWLYFKIFPKKLSECAEHIKILFLKQGFKKENSLEKICFENYYWLKKL